MNQEYKCLPTVIGTSPWRTQLQIFSADQIQKHVYIPWSGWESVGVQQPIIRMVNIKYGHNRHKKSIEVNNILWLKYLKIHLEGTHFNTIKAP